jgi:hypothetical protein
MAAIFIFSRLWPITTEFSKGVAVFSITFFSIDARENGQNLAETVDVYIFLKPKNRQIFALPLCSHSKIPQV